MVVLRDNNTDILKKLQQHQFRNKILREKFKFDQYTQERSNSAPIVYKSPLDKTIDGSQNGLDRSNSMIFSDVQLDLTQEILKYGIEPCFYLKRYSLSQVDSRELENLV